MRIYTIRLFVIIQIHTSYMYVYVYIINVFVCIDLYLEIFTYILYLFGMYLICIEPCIHSELNVLKSSEWSRQPQLYVCLVWSCDSLLLQPLASVVANGCGSEFTICRVNCNCHRHRRTPAQLTSLCLKSPCGVVLRVCAGILILRFWMQKNSVSPLTYLRLKVGQTSRVEINHIKNVHCQFSKPWANCGPGKPRPN